ncbi:MAG: hypothetical protein LC131_07390 [Anaerolineae bacterium]|nr:hypothetical protein [Anaerolineae bacterium]
MKVILTGTIAAGFGIEQIIPDGHDALAEEIVIKHLANGKLAEAIEVDSPRALAKRAPKPDPAGTCFVCYGSGIGNGFSMYGPFADTEIASEFAEDNRDDDEEWEIFEATAAEAN